MREILFRGKKVNTEEWIYGYYVNMCYRDKVTEPVKTGHFIVEYPSTIHEVYTSTIGQFTGLTDKNDKKIFEGDVVKGHYWAKGKSHRFIGIVKYVMAEFKIVGVKQYYGMHQELNPIYEVIGNIFDNPELLESGE